MKVQNKRDFNTALLEGEREIEYISNDKDKVIKEGLLSNIMFNLSLSSVICLALSVISTVIFLFVKNKVLCYISIVAFCLVIFISVVFLSVKIITKTSIRISLKLHRYNMKNTKNSVIFTKEK